jgi:predicted TIM-barrel enzyme
VGDGVTGWAGHPAAWRLEHELAFIAGLGTWAIAPFPLKKLLDGYVKGLEKRRLGFNEIELIHIRAAVQTRRLTGVRS